MQNESIENVAYIFEEKRSARTIEWKHLAVAAHLTRLAWQGRQHQAGTEESDEREGKGGVGAVPTLHVCEPKRGNADESAHDHHRVEAYESPAEKLWHCERLSPSAVIGIADDKAREEEKEVDSKVAVVDEINDRLVAGKLIAFKYVIPHHQQGGHSAQSVKEFIVGS